jgi:hypothetical protein
MPAVHGLIHVELQRFVETNHGREAWSAVLAKAGIEDPMYNALSIYPDEEIVRIVDAAVALTGASEADLLEAFGAFLVPQILRVYGALVKPNWRTLDVIEHTEETMHRAVRLRQRDAAPPRLRVERVSENEVSIVYESPRKMCALARGLVRGIAAHMREQVTISELRCMHRGDAHCAITVKREV